MTGPEHYRAAENLLRMAAIDGDQLVAETNLEPDEALTAAQVHATLALTAATALGAWLSQVDNDGPSVDTSDWYAAVTPTVPLPANPVTGRPPVLCVDATCPGCGWAERTFDTATSTFGCPKCEHTSKEREA